jgi:ABC-2 type transport system permease protein
MSARFSPRRLYALVVKETVQVLRDRLTFAMLVGIPVMQIILFGYAINTDPHNLPMAVLVEDNSPYARDITSALQATGYFDMAYLPPTEAEADQMMARNQVQFILRIPAGFGRDLVRGTKPQVEVDADATDPVATANAEAAILFLNQTALNHDLTGPLAGLVPRPPAFTFVIHNLYNPEGRSQDNIVPGLIGIILTMTLVMMTAVAMTRERERGTLENLLATPARPVEVMLGKIAPYVVIGYIQVAVILIAAKLLFNVPFEGSLFTLSIALVVFIITNLAIGFTFSTLAKSQVQAMQMGMFYFMPSMLLSGFLFPFRGMPAWAQAIGSVLPLTHALRITRGVMLKGNGWPAIWPDIWPMLLFMIVAIATALARYRQTLD